MIYFESGDLIIRDMTEADALAITQGELAQGWHVTIDKYTMRLRHQAEGKAIALVAQYQGNTAGYINVYPHQHHGPFADCDYPEIVDFGVLEKYRRLGIGSKLMDTAEEIAARYAPVVFLSVGLHAGYGSAQRMYIKRGYMPDGSGVWYNYQPCTPYGDCKNDDSLVLYLSKALR